VLGEAVSGIEKKGLLPDVDTRVSAATGETGAEASGLDKRAGTGQARQEPGWAGLRLCNLVAQSSRATKRTVPARGREGAYRERNRTLGDYLFQTLQKPDPSHRASARDGGSDAGKRPLPRLLSRDDLCGLSCRSESGRR